MIYVARYSLEGAAADGLVVAFESERRIMSKTEYELKEVAMGWRGSFTGPDPKHAETRCPWAPPDLHRLGSQTAV